MNRQMTLKAFQLGKHTVKALVTDTKYFKAIANRHLGLYRQRIFRALVTDTKYFNVIENYKVFIDKRIFRAFVTDTNYIKFIAN